ncbi:MAG: acyltransferase [bacterium]
MFQSIFTNYEVAKLSAGNANLTNAVIFSILLIASFLTLKKADSQLLDKLQTGQLKGLAILLVIIGHLWLHVSKTKSSIILSGDAVALFFLLSGYGLTMSSKNKKPGLRDYFLQRMKRVMVPYWIATVLLIVLDYLILRRSYPSGDILLTFLGININTTTRHIDYVRWYITVLILWYILFFVAASLPGRKKVMLFLLTCSAIMFSLNYYVTHLGWNQIFAFPVGCALGYYHPFFRESFTNTKNKPILFGVSLLCIVLSIGIKSFFLPAVITVIPSIVYEFASEVIGILFCMGLIYLFACIGSWNYYSQFLTYIGNISYELFLLHGALLIKYNPIVSGSSILSLSVQFAFLLMVTMLLASLFQKGIQAIA